MAFSDWTKYYSGKVTSYLNLGNPIIGAGSLSMISTFTDNSDRGVALSLNQSFSPGTTKGKMRSLIRINRLLSASLSNSGPGFFFMTSDPNPAGVSSNFYWVGLYIDNNMDVVIRRCVSENLATMVWSSGNLAVTTPSESVSANDIIPFQVEWEANLAIHNGTKITVSKGNTNDLNFDSLKIVLDIIDTSSPLLTTVSEGIGWASKGPGTTQTAVNTGFSFDQTGIFRLV